MMAAVCSCGAPDCSELGWPHEWDPIAASDTCVLAVDEVVALLPPHYRGTIIERAHVVRAPYVKIGSGYACAECAP
jgi:hypothetical protein